MRPFSSMCHRTDEPSNGQMDLTVEINFVVEKSALFFVAIELDRDVEDERVDEQTSSGLTSVSSRSVNTNGRHHFRNGTSKTSMNGKRKAKFVFLIVIKRPAAIN